MSGSCLHGRRSNLARTNPHHCREKGRARPLKQFADNTHYKNVSVENPNENITSKQT